MTKPDLPTNRESLTVCNNRRHCAYLSESNYSIPGCFFESFYFSEILLTSKL